MARMLFQIVPDNPSFNYRSHTCRVTFWSMYPMKLGQLIPDQATKVESKQAAQKRDHDNHSDIHTLQIGDPVAIC